MAQVFISYSRKDLAFVERLAADLKSAGLDIWYDVSKLGGGSRWRAEIENALHTSQYVVVVLSPDSIKSEWVEREFLYSSDLNLKIIPLMFRSCKLPLNYVNLNYIDVQGDSYKQNFHELLAALDVNDSIRTTPPLSNVKSSSFHLTTAHMALIAGGIVMAALFGLSLMGKMFVPSPTSTVTMSMTPENPTESSSADIVDDFGVNMVFIPPGQFSMGSNNGEPDEAPAHAVSLPSFYIDKYEVTNGFYRACVDAGKCTLPHSLSSSTRADYYENPEFDDFPVIFVKWDQAKAYCAWRGALLPSEAQWEKAARGTTGYIYPWGDEIDGSYANYDGAFRRDTTRVGTYELGKSMYGVYDMVGNVWEWVSSLYMPYPYRVDERENPGTSGERVVRGGSWYDHTAGLRSTDRYGDPTDDANDGLGFRCAREAYP